MSKDTVIFLDRLLDSGVLREAKRQELAATYHGLNLVSFLKQIKGNLECL